MTSRFLTAASVLALVSACSSQPGPSSLSPIQLANQALQAGNYSVAEQAYQGVLANTPNNPTAMLGLAQVYEATQRSNEAVDLYRKVSAAQSGAIRVFNDGSGRQDGVTELATRRLGQLGHGDMSGFETPQPALPVAAPIAAPAPAPIVQTEAWPDNPVYALDSNGMVFYADPGATQVVTEPVFESREAALSALPTTTQRTIQHTVPSVPLAPIVQETFVAPAPVLAAPTPIAPTPVFVAPAPVAPAPVVQFEEPTYALDTNGTVYYADPEATQPINETLFETREAAESAAPVVSPRIIDSVALPTVAPVFEPVAPIYQPAPVAVTPAPVFEPVAPTPIATTPAPVIYEPPVIAAPSPLPVTAPAVNTAIAAPTGALPRTSPGYAVVNGDFVYISAEDIARAGGGAAPVAPTIAPVAPQQSFTAPSVSAPVNPPLIELNGIPSIDLN